jgi:hypothetical protein
MGGFWGEGMLGGQVLVDHSIYAPRVGIQVNSHELSGELLDVDGNTVAISL